MVELWWGKPGDILPESCPSPWSAELLAYSTHLCIPSATAHLPATSGRLGEGWLSAIVDLNVFLLHARIQSPGRGWLFSGDVMIATSGSTGFHYRAQLGRLESSESTVRDQEERYTHHALRQGGKVTLKSCFRTFLKEITTRG